VKNSKRPLPASQGEAAILFSINDHPGFEPWVSFSRKSARLNRWRFPYNRVSQKPTVENMRDKDMDKIQFPYRSESHLAFLHVLGQSGSWEKHGLEVEYYKFISSEDAHKNVGNSTVEFVGGNHFHRISDARRAISGFTWRKA
jgi:hypothetical protein